MKKSPQNKNNLRNLNNSDKTKVAGLICIETSVYIEMMRIINSIPATNGRVAKLLPKLPKI
jgi:hypothetical protein